MRLKTESGLTLVELLVVVVCVAASFFVFAALSGAVVASCSMSANTTAVGMRGRDIFVAITGANAEREALGLSPVWPREFDRDADTNATDRGLFSVSNSTDYFRILYDEERLNTPQWSPYVSGFDYSKLAAAGVSACPGGHRLKAENNIWTIAKNMRDETDDLIPVLITRNIDASSLAARVGEEDLEEKALRFDPGWPTPFGDRVFVMVRKGGAIFKARGKYVAYRFVYANNWPLEHANRTFDTALTTNGVAAPPLKYLTPTREVTPSAQAYAEGAGIAFQLAGGQVGMAKRQLRMRTVAVAGAGPGLVVVAMIFLAVFGVRYAIGSQERRKFLTSGPVIGVWLCGYLEVACYMVGLAVAGASDARAWGFNLTALLAQAVGIGLALVFQRHNPAARRWQIGWLLAPLWIMLGLVFMLIGTM